jgi:rRNA biogenesis protein RRP5
MAPIEKKRKRVEEEPAFPRGGASVLTPLEHKQIQIEATRDVLFEQSTSRPAETKKRKTKGKDKGKKGGEAVEAEEEVIKVEGLNYKAGSEVLKHLYS